MIKEILAAMLSLPLAQYPQGMDPETTDQRTARFEVIAMAIDSAVSESTCKGHEGQEECTPWWPKDQGDELASMLVTLAWWESKFILRVHENKCFDNECDALKLGNGDIIHRARSVWQVQRNPRVVSKEEWVGMVGTSQEATRLAALAASRVLASSRARCAKGQEARWEHPTVSAYATGAFCSWSRADRRVTTYRKILKAIRSN